MCENGVFKTYHDNGNIWEEGYYVDGQLQGTFREYDKSGKLIVQCIFKDHKLNGKFTKWRNVDLGILEETAMYKDDIKLYSSRFDEESRIAGDYYFESGQCIRATEYRRSNGFVYMATTTANPRSYIEEVFPIA
jgi:antitoxin component YwqK of YwqJK toxin-antitoxin module